MFIPEVNEVVLEDIRKERLRQEKLREAGKFQYTAADLECPDLDRMSALMEEVGEAATASMEERKTATPRDGKPSSLRKELIQVAAVACAWVESIDVRADTGGELDPE